MLTTRSRRFVVAAAGLALAAGLATGCGNSSSEARAATDAEAADAVLEPAPDRLAMDRALAQRLIREQPERPAANQAHDHLATDPARAQRLIHEQR